MHDLKQLGVKVVPADLRGPQNDLVNILKGVDVVISNIHYQSLTDEIPLSNGAKAAGVKQYVPCFLATVALQGVMQLHNRVSLHTARRPLGSVSLINSTEGGYTQPRQPNLSSLYCY